MVGKSLWWEVWMNWLESLIWYNCHDQLVINHDQKLNYQPWSIQISGTRTSNIRCPMDLVEISFPPSYSTPPPKKTLLISHVISPTLPPKIIKEKNTWGSPVRFGPCLEALFNAKPQGFKRQVWQAGSARFRELRRTWKPLRQQTKNHGVTQTAPREFERTRL